LDKSEKDIGNQRTALTTTHAIVSPFSHACHQLLVLCNRSMVMVSMSNNLQPIIVLFKSDFIYLATLQYNIKKMNTTLAYAHRYKLDNLPFFQCDAKVRLRLFYFCGILLEI